MSGWREEKVCSVCGKTHECASVRFYPVKGKSIVRLTPACLGKYDVLQKDEFSLDICHACAKAGGKTPVGAWITAILSHIIVVLSIVAFGTGKDAIFEMCGIAGLITGLCGAMISGMLLIMKCRHMEETGTGKILVQMIPVIGLVVLCCKASTINRCAESETALRSVAVKHQTRLQEEGKAREQRAQQGCLTQEDRQAMEDARKQEETRQMEVENIRQERKEQEKSSRIKFSGIGILITAGFGVYGATLYSSGRGYVELFGIRLSGGAFAIIIGVLIVLDVISIVRNHRSE